jgi:Ca2+-binding RTX toxin-like protein
MTIITHDQTIPVNSVTDHSGTSENDLFVLTTISSGSPDAILDGREGVNTLDARNVFSGSIRMFFTDTEVNGENGFSFGDFQAVNFHQIYGNSSRGNYFTLQYVTQELILHGGAGDDVFTASFGPTGDFTADVFYGYGGDDLFNLRPLDQAFGGDGNDVFTLYPTTGDLTGSRVVGGAGTDTLDLSFGWTVDLALGFADSPFAGNQDRYAVTGIENVEVYAWRGYETRVFGTTGDNVFSVDSAFDDGSVGVVFNGRAGDDQLTGSTGNDTLLGGTGGDVLSGRNGDDTLKGGNGRDVLNGGSGDDDLRGHNGADRLNGQGGSDMLRGGKGNDILNGNKGADHLNGDDGADTLTGGQGRDSLTGGAGADIFVFDGTSGFDRVLDFEQGTDILRFVGQTGGFAGLTIEDFSNTLRISHDGGIVQLAGAAGTVLTASDFDFI